MPTCWIIVGPNGAGRDWGIFGKNGNSRNYAEGDS